MKLGYQGGVISVGDIEGLVLVVANGWREEKDATEEAELAQLADVMECGVRKKEASWISVLKFNLNIMVLQCC